MLSGPWLSRPESPMSPLMQIDMAHLEVYPKLKSLKKSSLASRFKEDFFKT